MTLPGATAGGRGDPSLGGTGPWCNVRGSPRVSCTKWIVTTFDDPTAWLATTGRVVVRRSQPGHVEVRDLADGALVWRTAGVPPALEVGLAADLVVLREERRVRGLQLEDGRAAWRVELPTASTRMVVDDDTVVVALADGTVLALDRTTGSTRWQHALGPLSDMAPLDGAVALAAATRGTLTLVDTTTGEPRWETVVAGAPTADIRLAASGRRLVATVTVAVSLRTLGEVVDVDPADGAVRWRRPLAADRAGRSPVAVAGEIVVLGGVGSDALPVLGLGPGGALLWQVTVGTGTTRPVGMPGDGGLLLAGASQVRLLDPADGTTLWTFGTGATAVAAGDIVVAGGPTLLSGVVPPD